MILVCIEDSPEATVRPRLEAMGADLSLIHILDGFCPLDGGEPELLDLSKVDHRQEFRRLVEDVEAVLVVVDPVMAHLGGSNTWKDSEVRSVLAPLARMADETGVAVLLVRHLRKDDSASAIYRAGGSIAWHALQRQGRSVEIVAVVRTRKKMDRAGTILGNWAEAPAASGAVDPARREIAQIEQAIRGMDDAVIEKHGGLQGCLERIVELKDLLRSARPGTAIDGFTTWRSSRLPGGGS